MKGYRTIIGNIVGGVGMILLPFGITIPPEMQTEFAGGAVAAIGIFNIFMRFLTSTPVGQKE